VSVTVSLFGNRAAVFKAMEKSLPGTN
jgi:hypothetical protein